MKKNSSSPTAGGALRKLALYALVGLAVLYVAGVAAGYSWLHFVRKNERIGVTDVALFQMGAIRRSIAAQHFASAQVEWDAKKFQAAYLLFSAAVRQDPDNIPGRLTAVRFLRSVGAANLAVIMLEDGLARAPEDRRLIEPTFDLLLAGGRERHLLEVLRKSYGAELDGPNGALLQRYEVQATLNAEGAPAAKRVLERHPGLLSSPPAVPVVARVLWESTERSRAISLLQDYVRTQPLAAFPEFALLAGWQETAGLPAEAVQIARRAVERFPRETAPRVLLIEMLIAENPNNSAGPQAIADYLRDFGSRPEALPELASLAGRKGWVDFARSLYEIGASRQLDIDPLALSYSDALARASRFPEARQVLADIEVQNQDAGVAFQVALRQRQVIAAAALGDSDNVREYARRLAAGLSRDPDGLEVCRRLFQRLKIAEAVAELTPRVAPLKAAATPPRK